MTDAMRVAFLPRHATSWVKMFDLAVVLQRDGRMAPVMLLATSAMAQRRRECETAGIDCIDLSAEIDACGRGSSWAGRVIRRVTAWLARHDWIGASLAGGLLQAAVLRRQLRAERDVFRTFFQTLRPCALLAPGDRELSPVPPALKAAQDLAIPVVVAASSSPYTEGLVHARQHLHRFQLAMSKGPPVLNLLARHKFPQQAIATGGGPILFSPGWLTLALAAEGMLSANPWIQGAGNSDYHLQHSHQRMAGFIRLGAPANRMVMVGDTALDTLHHNYASRVNLRSGLDVEYCLDPDSPVIVMAVPNDAEHGVCSWDEHLARIEAFFATLASGSANVMLSLHPKSPIGQYALLAKKYGLRIARQRLYDILPAANLYICSGSSTVHWAQLCGIPVINLDYLNIRDADFASVAGIVNIIRPDELNDLLQEWRAGRATFGNVAERAVELRKDCLFDGQAGTRICNFLNTLPRGTEWMTQEGNRKSAA